MTIACFEQKGKVSEHKFKDKTIYHLAELVGFTFKYNDNIL